MADYTEYKIGDTVEVLSHRAESRMYEYGKMKVIKVFNNESIKHTAHPQSIVTECGHVFSCWWFDPKAPELFRINGEVDDQGW